MSANAIQIGGSHYNGDYQHWDWVSDCNIHYLMGCATKYVVRWRKKNGLQDLEKAKHYLMKMEELIVEGRYRPTGTTLELRQRRALTEMFIRDNCVDPTEAQFIYVCALWDDPEELAVAAQAIDSLIMVASADKF